MIVGNSPATAIPKFNKAGMRDHEPLYTGPDEAARIETFQDRAPREALRFGQAKPLRAGEP